jgi:hypothetical protein
MLTKTTSQQASGSPIHIDQHTPFFAGCPQNWQSGLEVICDNYGDTLGIQGLNHANAWTMDELNNILENNLVPGTKGHLSTLGAIQWESELFNGRPKAWCYPFDLPKHQFLD